LSTLTIQIDPHTENGLRLLSEREGHADADVAARTLARAVRSARTRPTYDAGALRQAYAAFAEEDQALADSGAEDRAALLIAEIQA
jgi:hypothetical protein